jgi:outer membrane protein assembly factor BamB
MKLTLNLIVIMIFVFFILNTTLAYSSSEKFDDKQNVCYSEYITDWSLHVTNQNNAYDSNIPVFNNGEPRDVACVETPARSTDGPKDSTWPMLSHDIHHSGHSQFSTADNQGVEIWRVHGDSAGAVWGSAVVNRGLVYFGTKGSDSSLYALYPNGTRKWRFPANDLIWGTPALSEDGIIYFTTWGTYFYAINPDGTERWRFNQESISTSSSTVGEDGTIYFGTDFYNVFALNPNGTEKWRYTTGYIVMGSPTIDQNGTIYIGSGDHYLYALYPNGTLHWRFETGGEIKGSASIATDGTVYIPSFDGYLYALCPNGTMKWRVSTGGSIAAAGVALAEDGTIYVGTEQLHAFNPNGTLKWCTDMQGTIYGTVPAVSADGTIYVSAGDLLVAVNPNGTEKWRKPLSNEQVRSSPSIGNDGQIYVGSTYSDYGYLHAFGIGPLRAEAYGPYNGAMTEPLQFTGEAFGGAPPYTSFCWDFGDNTTSQEQNPKHTYPHRGNYTANLTVTDSIGNQSADSTEVTIGYPLPKITIIKPANAIYIFNIRICPFAYPLIIGRITIIVDASQVDANIDRVEFYYNGQLMKTDSNPPYKWVWTGHPPPTHQNIVISAIDTRGNRNDQILYIDKWF